MTGRPRTPDGGGTGDGGTPPGKRPSAGSFPHGVRSVAQAEEATARVAQRGRPGASGRSGPSNSGGRSPPPELRPGDLELREAMRRYEQLGDEPPRFNIARNDAAHGSAHTLDRHGPDIPLRRDLGTQTIEGRIYGDTGWGNPENRSYQWTDHTTMNREVNEYVRNNWETIRSDLAIARVHEGSFDAGHRVGQGYYNTGMYGAGPRQAQYSETSVVKVRIRLVPGSDPAQPFVVSAFPALLL